jgi:hypothetical protein
MPLTGAPSLQDWLLISQLSALGNQPSDAPLRKYLSAVGPIPPFSLTANSTFVPATLTLQYPTRNVVGFLGTQFWEQWFAHLIGAAPVMTAAFPGAVNYYFSQVALESWKKVLSTPDLDTTKPFVFAGHSLGAATALLCGLLAQQANIGVEGVYGVAMPQAIDAIGEALIAFQVWKLSGTKDPIPMLPPTDNITIPIPSKLKQLLRLGVTTNVIIGGYADVGDETCLDNGVTGYPPQPGRERCFLSYDAERALIVLVTTFGKYHYAASYVQYLKPLGTCEDKQPGAQGYDAPYLLWDLDEAPVCGAYPFLNPQPAPVDPAVWQPLNLLKCQVQCASSPSSS